MDWTVSKSRAFYARKRQIEAVKIASSWWRFVCTLLMLSNNFFRLSGSFFSLVWLYNIIGVCSVDRFPFFSTPIRRMISGAFGFFSSWFVCFNAFQFVRFSGCGKFRTNIKAMNTTTTHFRLEAYVLAIISNTELKRYFFGSSEFSAFLTRFLLCLFVFIRKWQWMYFKKILFFFVLFIEFEFYYIFSWIFFSQNSTWFKKIPNWGTIHQNECACYW